mgnify:CR=1 FL=1
MNVLSIAASSARSEEHTSELQSRLHLVCRLLLEKRITHKRIRISWLLLLVYLPMLLAVTFHHHGEAQGTHADFYCADCAHHVHHDGHLIALQNTMHDCVLCQLQSTPYLAPSLVVWVAIAVLHLSPRRAFCSPCLCRAKGVKSTRAPPYYQFL